MRYQIKGGPLVYKCFAFCIFNFWKNLTLLTYLKKKYFKCVDRPREHFINRFLWTYTFIKRANLTSKLQNRLCKKQGKKNQDIEKNVKFLPEFFKSFLNSQSACCLLSIIFCNITKVVILTYVKMSRLVRLLLYTSDGENAFI